MHSFVSLHPCPIGSLHALVSEDMHAVHLSRGVSGRLGEAWSTLARAATPRLTAGWTALLTASSLFAPTTPLRARILLLFLLLLLLQQPLLIRPVELLVFILMRRHRPGPLLLDAAVAVVGGVRLQVGRIPYERTGRVVLLHLALLQAELEVLVVDSTSSHKDLRLVRARVFCRCRHHHRDRATGLSRCAKHQLQIYLGGVAACRFKQAGIQRASRLLLQRGFPRQLSDVEPGFADKPFGVHRTCAS